jgi:hypothetical protein
MPGKKKPSVVWENVGKAFFDMGKLVFGSVVLGALLRADANVVVLFLFGITATVLLFIGGAIILKLNEE